MSDGEKRRGLSKKAILDAWCSSGRNGNVPSILDFAERLIRLYESSKSQQ